MRIHFIIHAGFEKAAHIATWAAENAFAVRYTHLHKGETCPDIDDFDMLICMGGPQSPSEIERYPYLMDEIRLIREAIIQGKIVLGVCLGAQLIAESYGIMTEKSPNKEVGFFPVDFSDDRKQDPVFFDFPASLTVGHWHNDMPGCPDSAVILARSEGCPRQVIRFSPKVYGLQCHFELDSVTLRALIRHCPDDLLTGKYIQTAEEMLAVELEPIQQYLSTVLTRLSQL